MIINRNNFEEFFLLYVDNELTEHDRAAVEKFVSENPDLVVELEMLKQARLEDEESQFEHKEFLYKKEIGISLRNYQEYFLLSVDKELLAAEADQVEKFVLKHPELQDEFTLLQQAIIEPEHLEYAGKKDLYRTQKKERILPFTWMRVSIAAAVLSIIAAGWLILPSSTINGPVAVAPIHKRGNAPAMQPQKLPPNDAVVNRELAGLSEEKKEVVKAPILAGNTPTKQALKTVVKMKRGDAVPVTNPIQAGIAGVKDKDVAVTTIKNETPESDRSSTVVSDRINKTGTSQDLGANMTFASNGVKEQPVAAMPAVYSEIDNSDEERSFYIGGAEINKNKLKGLLKKATSLFGKKAGKKDNERTVQIAGFEIKS